MPDTIGNGASEGNLPRTGSQTAEQARSVLADIQRGVSRGFVRGTIGAAPSALSAQAVVPARTG